MPISYTVQEVQNEAVDFIHAYRQGCIGLGHPDPNWSDELVRETAAKLVEQEQYEDDEHFGMCFPRDLAYTLEHPDPAASAPAPGEVAG